MGGGEKSPPSFLLKMNDIKRIERDALTPRQVEALKMLDNIGKKKKDTKRRVHIVGKGTGQWNVPKEGELWGLNDMCLKMKNLTLTFEIHDIDKLLDTTIREERFVRSFKEEIKEINKLNIPVIIQKKHKAFPNGIVFPIDKIPFRYLTSSVAFMMAYAIHEKVDSIDIYGIPLFYEEEYTFERPCIEFWIGYAMGQGIEVKVHKPSYLLTAAPNYGVYAYDWGYRYNEKQNELVRSFK